METTAMISVKRAIKFFPYLAMAILTKEESAINEFANKAGLTPEFIRLNLPLIKNWI